MPNPTYPGVYVSEVSTGERSVTGVPTAITAFLGRTQRGPVGVPTECHSPGDFERVFGGLSPDFPLSYSIDDFFANGGGQAVVVRLYHPPLARPDGLARLSVGGLELEAASPGVWGDNLVVTVLASNPDGRFDLAVQDTGAGRSEIFRGLSLSTDDPHRIDRALRSELIRLSPDEFGQPVLPAAPPSAGDTATAAQGHDGRPLGDLDFIGDDSARTGLYTLENVALFDLLVIPPDALGGDISHQVWDAAARYCDQRRAFLIVDPPAAWDSDPVQAVVDAQANQPLVSGAWAANAALYYPRYRRTDPLQGGAQVTLAPSGAIAGIYAKTDADVGCWKAPAGVNAPLARVESLTVPLNDDEAGQLNPIGVNCLRTFTQIGPVIWGARTLRGADILASDFKYVPVRRLALYIEESLLLGTRWAVFEPNGEALWAALRLNIGAFMNTLFRQGAFFGASASEAYFVTCDSATTSLDDMARGVVNVMVGFAPVRPAEFVVLRIQVACQQDT